MTETANTTTASGVDQLISNYYNQRAQDRLVANFVFNQFPEKKKLGKNNGQTMIFHRFDNVSGSTSTLTQGTTTAGNTQLSATTTTVTVSEYGQFIAISGFAVDTIHTNDLMDAASDVLSDAASDTVDRLVRDNLISNATSRFAGGGTSASITTADVASASELKIIARNFATNKVKPFADGKKYIYICHPLQAYDLKSDDTVFGFAQTNMYVDNKPVLNNEIGTFCGFRVIETPQVLSTAAVTSALSSTSLAYQAFAIGMGAQTAVDVEGSPIKIIVHKAGSAGTADPYDNVNTVAYKIRFGVVWQGGDGPRAYRHITSTTA